MPEEKKEPPLTNSSTSYKIFCTQVFIGEARKLAKKYPNIKADFLALKDRLKKDPVTGNDSLGQQVYKVRMQISDKKKGSSGGARVIIQVKIIDRKVYVLSVYDKGRIGTLIDTYIKKLIMP